jgi:hypothetical protein
LYLKIGGRISDYQGNYTPIGWVCEIVLDSGTSGTLELRVNLKLGVNVRS